MNKQGIIDMVREKVSINASNSTETPPSSDFGAVFALVLGTMKWSRVGDPALWPENTGQQGIISQDSTETKVLNA